MPCDSSQGMADSYREDPEARKQVKVLKAELDKVTRLLCSVLSQLSMDLPPDLAAWYAEHKEWDRSQGR